MGPLQDSSCLIQAHTNINWQAELAGRRCAFCSMSMGGQQGVLDMASDEFERDTQEQRPFASFDSRHLLIQAIWDCALHLLIQKQVRTPALAKGLGPFQPGNVPKAQSFNSVGSPSPPPHGPPLRFLGEQIEPEPAAAHDRSSFLILACNDAMAS